MRNAGNPASDVSFPQSKSATFSRKNHWFNTELVAAPQILENVSNLLDFGVNLAIAQKTDSPLNCDIMSPQSVSVAQNFRNSVNQYHRTACDFE